MAEAVRSGGQIVLGDSLTLLERLPDQSCELIYIDPPFNTGRIQERQRILVKRRENGSRGGFGGGRYEVEKLSSSSYPDSFEDFLDFMRPRLVQARRVLKPNGSLFLHIDCREVHYMKILLDEIFGRASFFNEIIWAYDYGGKPKIRWPAKHDNILWYVKNPKDYVFHFDAIDRVPYMAPDLVGPEKALRGKIPTDVWWMTIVPTNSREKTGYPTQKPLKLLNRIVRVHSNPGDLVLDFFAGSGTAGEAAAKQGRRFLLADNNPDAVDIMAKRLAFATPSVSALTADPSALDLSVLG